MSHVRRKPTKRPVKSVKKKSDTNWIALIVILLILISSFVGIIFMITFT